VVIVSAGMGDGTTVSDGRTARERAGYPRFGGSKRGRNRANVLSFGGKYATIQV